MSDLKLTCPECGLVFAPTHHRAVFCTPVHKRAFYGRQQARGQRIAVYAQAWRLARHTRDEADKGTGRDALSALSTFADEWNAEDKAAGRPSAIRFLQGQAAREGVR